MRTWLPFFVILVIGGAAAYYDVTYLSKGITAPFGIQTPAVDKTKEISLEQVNNLGYTFYVGQIDNPGTAPISDTVKNDITRVIYNSKFPKSILEKTPIVFVNNLALKPEQYVAAHGEDMAVPTFGPAFLYEGGVYGTYHQSDRSIIYINNDVLPKMSLNEILTHELGHAIGKTLTDADWTKYYQLREIASGTPRYGSNWNLSPGEDFAEVYKNTFIGTNVRTYYGLLLPSMDGTVGAFSLERTCGTSYTEAYNSAIANYEKTNPPKEVCGTSALFFGDGGPICNRTAPYTTDAQLQQAADSSNANAKVQDCRRNVMAHPDQYPDDWKYGMAPYKSTVGPQTKEFINTIVGKQN